MIVDTIDHADMLKLGPRFEKAFAWLKVPEHTALPAGHYPIEVLPDGTEALFANIQEYETRTPENCPLEYHRRYADIQMIFAGEEAIGYRPLTADLPELKPYSEANDIGFVKGEGAPVPFSKDTFFVLFPQDAHAPGKQVNGPNRVRKIVVKVLL